MGDRQMLAMHTIRTSGITVNSIASAFLMNIAYKRPRLPTHEPSRNDTGLGGRAHQLRETLARFIFKSSNTQFSTTTADVASALSGATD